MVWKWHSKGVAVNEIPKLFVLFSVKVLVDEDNGKNTFLTGDKFNMLFNHDNRCWNIYEFPHHTVQIDFNKPQVYVDTFNDMVSKVENECPVGKHFGVTGIGEGLVLKGYWDEQRFWFKIKGDKHQKAGKGKKSKTNTQLSPEVLESRTELAKTLTEPRLAQMIEVAKLEGKGTSKGEVGFMINWMRTDILKE